MLKKKTLQDSNFKNKPSRMQTKLNHEKGQKQIRITPHLLSQMEKAGLPPAHPSLGDWESAAHCRALGLNDNTWQVLGGEVLGVCEGRYS